LQRQHPAHAQRLAPLHRAWNRLPDGLDLLLLVGNRAIDVAVVAATLGLIAHLVRPLSLWPTTLPLPAQAALGILLGEPVEVIAGVIRERLRLAAADDPARADWKE